MTSPRRIPATQSVSLFPFLAVLLCTMGALLVLLVVMARQARVRAATEASDESVQGAGDRGQGTGDRGQGTGDRGQGTEFSRNAEGEEVEIEARKAELAALRDRAKQLDQINGEATSRFGAAGLHLGHAEEQLRLLQDRVVAAYASAKAMDNLEKNGMADRERAKKEIDRLHDLVQETEEEVEQTRKNLEQRSKSYAIIPYEGVNGTHRRPLYIECRSDAVVLLPEGIELTLGDFQGPVGPGNPLAAALRAAREYHTASLADPTAKGVQPYPLLLVRPNGIVAYYLARKAIESWGPDFGYELIDGDWSLELPPADPHLAHLEYRAIETARARQRQLAMAAPRRFRGSFGNGGRGGGDSGEFGVAFGAGDGVQGVGGGGQGNRMSNVEQGMSNVECRMKGTGGGEQGTGDGGQGNRMSNVEQGMSNVECRMKASEQYALPTQDQRQSAEDRSAQDKQAARLPNGRGGNTGGGSPAGGGSSGSALGGSQAFGAETPFGASQSGSRHRLGGGRQERSRDAVPIRRAIRVVVYRDRLAILPEQGVGGGRVVPVAESVDAAMDEFVSALQARMQSWGIAGNGLYWKPILVLKPAPDGTANADRLARRLRGSGIEIQIPGTTRR